jgi:hypothetical protein
MEKDWAANELKTVNLNDKRLNERLVEILKNLSKNPHLSIPAACGGHSETMAAYRFFENPKTTIQNILPPHRDATEQRIAEQKVVLFVQDTTELDLTRPEQQLRGIGPIGTSQTNVPSSARSFHNRWYAAGNLLGKNDHTKRRNARRKSP